MKIHKTTREADDGLRKIMSSAKQGIVSVGSVILLLVCGLFSGCVCSMSSCCSESTNREIWLKKFLGVEEVKLTQSEVWTLIELLDGYSAPVPPSGSPPGNLEYLIEVKIKGRTQIYYFYDDYAMMVGRNAPKNKKSIENFVRTIAFRMP